MQEDRIIYEEINGETIHNLLTEYIEKEGVWALYGQESEDHDYVCLNVGKCKDVGKEIVYDLGCLHFLPHRNDGIEEYVNQFAEGCEFKYKQNQVQEYLYPYIAVGYCAFKFVFVHDKSDAIVEADYAKENNAKFWRNGSPFGVKKKQNVNRKDIQLIGEYFQNGGERYSREELLRKLENDLGYDNTRAKKLITECQVYGFLTCVENDVYTR